MKKINKLFAIMAVGLLASGCSSNKITISNEEKVKPTTTNLEYDDYGVEKTLSHKYNTEKFYRNDLFLNLPDPCVVEENGVYYIYGTTDRTGAQTIDCYSTTDFTNFTPHRDVFKPGADSWGNTTLFAPEVFKIGDKYYMYYTAAHRSADGKTSTSGLEVAVCDSPNGTFVEYQGLNADGVFVDGKKGPIFVDKERPKIGILDGTILQDGNDLYLYYSIYDTGIMQYIVGVKLKDPVTADWSTYKVLLRPGAIKADNIFDKSLSWECFKDFRVAEGPQVTKTPTGKYMMSYSVNHYPDMYYTVCYAMSDDPLGTYEKPFKRDGYWTNILFGFAGGKLGTVYDQWQGFTGGTAHHFIFKVGEQYMIAYHALKNRKDISAGRGVGIDYLFFDKDGVPYVHGPSYSIQPLPEGVSGYKNVALNAEIVTEGVTNPERLNDNFIVEHYNLKQEKDKEANIKGGKTYIKIKLDKKYKVGGILIYNTAEYEKMVEDVDFINFGNGNSILDGQFNKNYIQHKKEFINPCSAFAFNLKQDVETDTVVIGFDNEFDFALNEIKILGK